MSRFAKGFQYNVITTIVFLFLALGFSSGVFADQDMDVESQSTDSIVKDSLPSKTFTRPRPFKWVTNLPHDYALFGKKVVKKGNEKYVAIIAASTAALIIYDQELLDGSKEFAKTINLSADNNNLKIVNWSVKVGKSSLPLPVYLPANLNTAFYFQGDGFTHMSIIAGFWGYGLINKDNRSLQTASQLLESLFAGGLATQFLKHITGRESPYVSSRSGGRWKFFPNQGEYSKHVPHYDAFPSGHLATFIGAVTIISNNYPESRLIKPIGYGMSSLLMFSMMNNGVHWTADYPLGFAIGYTLGNLISKRSEVVSDHVQSHTEILLKKIKPGMILPYGTGAASGISMYWNIN